VLDDLGLDEFLAKLKQVTRRTPGDRQNRAALSPVEQAELSRIDAEIEQLKPSMFAKNVIRAQRSAAPPPPATRSPRNSEVGRSFGSIFDELPLLAADGDCVFTAGNISSIATQPSTMQTEREIHGDVPLSQGINNIQSKILRMQEALKQSRDMRASLVSLELPAGEDIGMIKKQTRTVPMAARSAPPPPAVGPGIGTYGAPPNYDIIFLEAAPPTPDKDMDAIRREHNKWRMEASSAGSPQRTPPQLLRRSQILANPHSNQQSPPQMPNAVAVGMMDAGERPMSEQELLVQASHQYQGDPALQKKLWEMVSAGAIRSARELREVAEEQMKQRDVHAALSDMEKAPGHNRVTGPQHGAWDPRYAHQQNFAPSNDYSRPRNTNMTHFRQQPPAPLPLPKNSTRFTQPPAAYYPNAQGMPPAQPGGGGMQMGEDTNVLLQASDTLLSATPSGARPGARGGPGRAPPRALGRAPDGVAGQWSDPVGARQYLFRVKNAAACPLDRTIDLRYVDRRVYFIA